MCELKKRKQEGPLGSYSPVSIFVCLFVWFCVLNLIENEKSSWKVVTEKCISLERKNYIYLLKARIKNYHVKSQSKLR